MTTQNFDDDPSVADTTGEQTDPEQYGSLTVEDDPEGTTDPAELAGSADESDEDVKLDGRPAKADPGPNPAESPGPATRRWRTG